MDATDAINLAQGATQMKVDIAVQRKALDVQKLQANTVLQLLESAAQTIQAAEPGKGGQVDQQA